jgi:hypothetical protein
MFAGEVDLQVPRAGSGAMPDPWSLQCPTLAGKSADETISAMEKVRISPHILAPTG